LISLPCNELIAQESPKPGDIFKDFSVSLTADNKWRVTDPNASNSGAAEFLPNPVIQININDLDKAIKAEAIIEVWGGHAGTSGKKFRFNGNAWISIPSLPNLTNPDCYLSQYNVRVDLPLNHLLVGINTFEGTSGGQVCHDFGWGQWGWYVMIVRIYYSADKPHSKAEIVFPGKNTGIDEQQMINITTEDDKKVKKICLIGKYYGYDENGDGNFFDWHIAHHTLNSEGHIGDLSSPPWNLTWDTRWIPDQEPGSMVLKAYVQDTSEVWYVSGMVEGLSLIRENGVSVKMYTATNIPTAFSVRAGKTKTCWIQVASLSDVYEINLLHRTWNGADDASGRGTIQKPLIINNYGFFKTLGKNHSFAQSKFRVPATNLVEGSNMISYTSDTEQHGIEILWPGPALLVRSDPAALRVATPVFNPSPADSYTFPFITQITTATSGAVSYYTSDGRDPNTSDKLYLPPLVLTSPVTIKVRSFKDNMLESEVVVADFVLKTDVQNSESDNSVIIYPNPSRNQVNISLPLGESPEKIALYDSLGKNIGEYFDIYDGIDVSSLKPGLYFLQVYTRKKTHLNKMVIISGDFF